MAEYLVCSPDGHTSWCETPRKMTYDQYVALVGGPLEVIYPLGFDIGEPRAWGHEEARIYGAKVNPILTELAKDFYGYTMVGTFVLFDDDDQGEANGLDAVTRDRLFRMIKRMGYPVPTVRVDYKTALLEANVRRD